MQEAHRSCGRWKLAPAPAWRRMPLSPPLAVRADLVARDAQEERRAGERDWEEWKEVSTIHLEWAPQPRGFREKKKEMGVGAVSSTTVSS